MEFDLQRFAEDAAPANDSADTQTETADAAQDSAPEPIPEELGGLPEEYAREVMEQSKPAEENSTLEQPAPAEQPRDDYQAIIAERDQLKAQLAEYQRQQAQLQQQAQTQQPQQQRQPQPQYQPPQLQITPEVSAKIKTAIEAEAMALAGMSKDDVDSLNWADDDDPRLAQWNQAKDIAKDRIYTAIKQAQAARQQQAQQFLMNHQAAVQTYNEFAKKEFAEPDYKQIQQFATNEFFEQMPQNEQRILAQAYIRVEQQTASPAEMLAVKQYYERAKAAYRTRDAKKQTGPQPARQAANLPRADQLRGTISTGDVGLSSSDFEKLLKGDFTKIDEKTQKIMLGFS